MRTLGSAYTRTLRTQERQAVVAEGPYRVVRHPGYAGSLLVWLGFGLTSRSRLVVAIVVGTVGQAYGRRIIAEEELLRKDLPDYRDNERRGTRLFPYIW